MGARVAPKRFGHHENGRGRKEGDGKGFLQVKQGCSQLTWLDKDKGSNSAPPVKENHRWKQNLSLAGF